MNRADFTFYHLRSGEKSPDISLLFPGWQKGDERVAIFSPHDDDALLGPGYLLQAIPLFGGEIEIIIFCNGSGGYSTIEHKPIISALRARETAQAYQKLGIVESKIHRLDYDDYSVWPFIGWKLATGAEGTFQKILPLLRKLKITRVVAPNGYQEHLDHTATFWVASFDTPQAGDPVMADWGENYPVRSLLQYAVWSDFSPEDAFLQGESPTIRANLALKAPAKAEENIQEAMQAFRTQANIIAGLMSERAERQISQQEFIEVYLSFDPRPKCDYRKYINKIEEIDKRGGKE